MYQNGQDNLDELLDVLDGAHRYDRYIVAKCPFHDDTRPSFFVYEDKYRCLSCGAFGDTDKLLSKIKPSHTISVAKESFHNPFTRWTKEHDLAFVLKTAYKYRPSHYLMKRGISASTQKSLGIGIMDGWITFPIWDHNWNIVGAVARAGEDNLSDAKYVIPGGQNPDLLYVPSWIRINKHDKIFLTFGIIDAITLYMLGFAAASTTTGKRISPGSFDSIRKRIIIIPDAGEETEALHLASKLGWRGSIALPDYPDNTKDVNDLLQYDKDHDLTKKKIEALL